MCDHDLTQFNTLSLGAVAPDLIRYRSSGQLPAITQHVASGQNVFVLGGGSNVVLRPRLSSLVIKVESAGIRLLEDRGDSLIVEAEAGESWHGFVRHCVRQGWGGLENLALIPGTVGAAPVQNIGAYGVELDQRVHRVIAWDLQQGRLHEFEPHQCGFSYRDSQFKQAGPGRWLILKVQFAMPRVWTPVLGYPDLQHHERLAKLGSAVTPRDVFDAVCQIRRSKLPDPDVLANAGSFFKNPVGGTLRNDISADYFALFADRIQELLKADRQEPPFVGIMSNGTSGDVNNINFGAPAIPRKPYEQMKLVAEDVAREVFRAHRAVEFHDWVPLKTAEEELTLQVRKATPEMLTRAKGVIARPDTVKPIHRHEVTYANRILNLEREWPDNIDIVLQVFRVGDLGVAAIPFEVFAETGLEIKAKSPFQASFTISFANGSYGYLPTPEQHELGGYETWYSTNKVEVEASRKIVTTLLKMFESIK